MATRHMFSKLAQQVLENLSQSRPLHLSKKQLKNIDQVGIINVVIVSNCLIQKLNKQWRNIDKITDVLSFPITLDLDNAGLPFELGEVIISAAKAHEQAYNLGHGFERELAFLFVHGFLHVLGFDHITKPQETEMFSRQSQILEAVGYIR